MINTQSESLHWMRHRIGAILAEPVSITVSKKSLFLFLIGSVSLWILFTVIRGHDRTAGGYGSYLSSSLDFDESRECGIVPLPERIKDLKRIVISVRTEIADSSAKLDEVIKQYEEISHKIPEKQNQLAQVLAEIENARSLLRDLNDRRNVRVSLPSRPLLPLKTIVYSREEMSGAMEDSIDFSRCSLTTPLRIFLYPTSRSHPLYEVITNSPYYEPNPSSACLFAVIVSEHSNDSLKDLPYWSERGANHVILNTRESPMGRNETAHAIVAQAQFYPGSFRRRFDFLLPLSSSMRRGNSSDWEKMPTLLPYQRKYLLSLVVRDRWSTFDRDVERMQKSMKESEDEMRIIDCGKEKKDCGGMKDSLAHSHFTVLTSSSNRLIFDLLSALRVGSIPVVMRMDVVVPFEDFIDWSPVLLRFPAARLHELHFLLRDVPMADGLEMRRRGRRVLEEYLDSVEGVWTSLAAALSQRLSLPPIGHNPVKAPPLFNRTSFVAPIQTPVNLPVYSDDEYLGPLEAPFESPQFLHNVTSMSMYSYTRWNSHFSLGGTPEYSIDAVEMPNGAEFEEDTSSGFRPIEPGSGKEFSLALGGNRQREQFTIVMLTYNRDAILAASLEGLHKLPYLNKVIVIWNNIEREPQGAWPRLHVPVEFIRGEMNSLNNRFIPWDRIQTEAVLSLDDDIDLKQHEIVFAFRVWREQRRKIVGFPARQHSRFGSDLFYNSNHTCQMSMILTGAAFIHKSYLYSYTFDMPAAIREHVDKVTNCEDIAMNFLIAHLTREPPMKTTSKWTLRCPTCTDSLWSDGDHFNERHECIRLFTRIYGYNPLRYSQYRADSILFKTRIPTDMQKCFRYV